MTEAVAGISKSHVLGRGLRGLGVQLTGRVARLGYELVVSRVLGAAGFGLLAVAVSVFDVSRAFAYAGLDHAIVRFVAISDSRGDRSSVRAVLKWGIGLALLTATATAVGLVASAPWLARDVFRSPALVPGLRFIAIALLPNVLLITSAAAVRARGQASLERFLQTFLPPVALAVIVGGSVLTTRSLSAAWPAFAAAYGLCAVVAIGSAWRVFADLRNVPTASISPRPVLAFALPMLLTSVAYILLTEMSRLLLGALGAPREVGVYTVASRLAVQITIFYVGFDSIIAPVVAALSARGERTKLQDIVQATTSWVAGLSVLAAMIVFVVAEPLLGLFGREFAAGSAVLRVLVLGQLLLVLVGPTSRLLQMSGRAGIDAFNTAMAVGIVAVLGAALIPRTGAMGAGVATVGGIVVLNLLQYAQVRVLLRIEPMGRQSLRAVVAGAVGVIVGVLLDRALLTMLPSAMLGGLAALVTYGLTYSALSGVHTPSGVMQAYRDFAATLGRNQRQD